jgi:hypothetical protein
MFSDLPDTVTFVLLTQVDEFLGPWLNICCLMLSVPISVAARSKALVCGRLLAGIAGSNPARVFVSCDGCVLCI